ncbi:MAG: hypothetical protein M0Z51_00865 [Propionibacterium sp.]|nr:hypothetical protein [Propionibacterium sp.]
MESAEHAWLGDRITLTFESGDVPAQGLPLALPLNGAPGGPNRLTYGQLVALGGDFYGVVGGPISTAPDSRVAFLAAFTSLGTDWTQLQEILAVMAEEIAAVTGALASGEDPSKVYGVLGDSLSMRWNEITGGENIGPVPVVMGRYLKLAAENWDHFAGYAITAYRAGHAIAMDHAASARTSGLSPADRQVRLQEAYAFNAFADHFLTDLFSAGHLRVPRKELYEQVTTPIPGRSGTMGSLLSRSMHDEDSRVGLTVHNAAGNTWVAYGDKRLLDAATGDNRAMAVRATQASATDVWNAYQGAPQQDSALALIPDVGRVLDVSTRENFSPLFVQQGGSTNRRNDVTNRNDYSWTSNWWGWSTWAAIQAAGSRDYVHVKCYSLTDDRFLGWLGVGYNNYTVLVADEQDAHGLVWYADGDDLYLRKDTSGGDRYLGEGVYSYADWGLWGGNYKSPVLYNADQTLSLKGAPTRKLYLYKDNQLCWSNGEEDLEFVRVDLPVGDPFATF